MRNKRSLLILIVLLVIGFASVSTTLIINGVIGVSNKKEDFNIIFTNAKLDGVEKKEFIDSETKQTINYETNKLTTINETTTLEYDVTNTSRIYDAEVSITCNIVDDAGNEATSEYVSMEYIPASMTIEAGKTKTGSITTKLIKGSTEDKTIKVKCTLNATATERDSIGAEYVEPKTYDLINDINNNEVADIGDEITVGTESFYVISHTNTELNALAKYNLNVGNNYNKKVKMNIQHESIKGYVESGTIYGNVTFSNSKGWPYENNDTINIKDYAGIVKDALYGDSGYESYIQETLPKATIRLINKHELESLVNDNNLLNYGSIKDKADAKGYSWIYNTSYWTQSAYSGYDGSIWAVDTTGMFFYDRFSRDVEFGVRPVITIPLS